MKKDERNKKKGKEKEEKKAAKQAEKEQRKQDKLQKKNLEALAKAGVLEKFTDFKLATSQLIADQHPDETGLLGLRVGNVEQDYIAIAALYMALNDPSLPNTDQITEFLPGQDSTPSENFTTFFRALSQRIAADPNLPPLLRPYQRGDASPRPTPFGAELLKELKTELTTRVQENAELIQEHGISIDSIHCEDCIYKVLAKTYHKANATTAGKLYPEDPEAEARRQAFLDQWRTPALAVSVNDHLDREHEHAIQLIARYIQQASELLRVYEPPTGEDRQPMFHEEGHLTDIGSRFIDSLKTKGRVFEGAIVAAQNEEAIEALGLGGAIGSTDKSDRFRLIVLSTLRDICGKESDLGITINRYIANPDLDLSDPAQTAQLYRHRHFTSSAEVQRDTSSRAPSDRRAGGGSSSSGYGLSPEAREILESGRVREAVSSFSREYHIGRDRQELERLIREQESGQHVVPSGEGHDAAPDDHPSEGPPSASGYYMQQPLSPEQVAEIERNANTGQSSGHAAASAPSAEEMEAERIRQEREEEIAEEVDRRIEALLGDDCKCSMTLSVMRDPVIATDGNSYEREAIEKWLSKNETCPITRVPCTKSGLRPNRTLKGILDKQREQIEPQVRKEFEQEAEREHDSGGPANPNAVAASAPSAESLEQEQLQQAIEESKRTAAEEKNRRQQEEGPAASASGRKPDIRLGGNIEEDGPGGGPTPGGPSSPQDRGGSPGRG